MTFLSGFNVVSKKWPLSAGRVEPVHVHSGGGPGERQLAGGGGGARLGPRADVAPHRGAQVQCHGAHTERVAHLFLEAAHYQSCV